MSSHVFDDNRVTSMIGVISTSQSSPSRCNTPRIVAPVAPCTSLSVAHWAVVAAVMYSNVLLDTDETAHSACSFFLHFIVEYC